MANKQPKPQLNPGEMFIAILLVLGGAVVMLLSVVYFDVFGLWPALLCFVMGLTTSGFAITAITSGNKAWILLDLVSPF